MDKKERINELCFEIAEQKFRDGDLDYNDLDGRSQEKVFAEAERKFADEMASLGDSLLDEAKEGALSDTLYEAKVGK